MGKIVITKNRGMNLWAKFALVTLCTLMVSAFMGEGLIMPRDVQAATQIQYATGDNSATATWTITGAATRWEAISEVTANDATYIAPSATNQVGNALFNFPAFSIPAGSTITNVTVSYRHSEPSNGANTVGPVLTVNGTSYNGTTVNPTTTWTTTSYAYTTNPNTGLAWTIADVNGTGTNPLQAFGVFSTDANPLYRVSQVYVAVNYTPDTTAPIITTFTVPATSSSLTIDGITLIASDAVGVTGYLINEVASPAPSAAEVNLPSIISYTAASAGAKTLYAWARDAAGNVSLSASQTCTITVAAPSPLMHNSDNLVSKYGTWGTDKSCTWCHTTGQTANVKRISQTIVTPGGIRNVIFYRMTASMNNYTGVLGNDLRTYGVIGKKGSTNICEVCHNQTKFHLYSLASEAAGGHYDNQLCTACHSHAQGFKANGHDIPAFAVAGEGHISITTCTDALGCHANQNPAAPYPTAATPPDCRSCHAKDDPTAVGGCGSCHGDGTGSGQPVGTAFPDRAGSHAAHTVLTDHVTGQPVVCANCHSVGGSGGEENHGNNSRNVKLPFVNLSSSFGWNSTDSTCASAKCHVSPYSAAPLPLKTPSWGTTAGCSSCHKDGGAFSGPGGSPQTGSHNAHLTLPGATCNQCHEGAISGSTGGTNHDDGDIDVANGYPATQRHPAGTYAGTCSTAYCHSDPYSTSRLQTPVWGQVSGCASCHLGTGAFQNSTGHPRTGSHSEHMALAGSACNQCHDGAEKFVKGGNSHAQDTETTQGTIDVTNDYTGSPVTKHSTPFYTGYCMNASCHASPYGTDTVISPVWGMKVGCASCHNGNGAFTARFGSPSTGSHYKHLALHDASCGQCHEGAVAGVNPGINHNDPERPFVDVTGGYTASPVTRHPIGTYNGTCANSCHTNGNGTQLASPRWGVAMPANCSGCHGGSSIATPASAVLATGKHRAHMNNHSTLGRGNDLKCAECHAKTVSLASNIQLSEGSNHINQFKDYSGVNAGGSNKYVTATGVCSNVYCHSSGQAVPVYRNMTGSKAWRGTAKFDCNGCHGRDNGANWDSGIGAPNYDNHSTVSTANSHEKHVVLNGMADTRGCAKCHRDSVSMTVVNKFRNYSTTHLNRKRDVSFSIFGAYSANTKSCTTYCHSNVQSPGGAADATVYAKPEWGHDNGTMTCASCHKNMTTLVENAGDVVKQGESWISSNDLTLGSHRRHAVYNNTTGGASGTGYSCDICHGSGYNATSVVGSTHSDGIINVNFTGKGAGTTYSQGASSLPANDYGTCSTSKCHGRAIRTWALNTSLRECEKCHGSARMAKEEDAFKDTGGNTTGGFVGTHVSHLAAKHGLTAPMQCSECHIVPAQVNSFDHMSSLPARIVWGVLSVRSSNVRGAPELRAAMVPFYNPATKTCNNTYCHAGVQIKTGETVTYQGQKPNPSWNDPSYLGGMGCNMCHGYPPAGVHTTSLNCNACHNHVDQSNLSMADRTRHLNGIVETTVDECLGCHSSFNTCSESDPSCVNKKLVGGHMTHTNSELFLAGKKLSADDYIDPTWIYEIIYDKGFPQYACGFCHPMNTALHKNGRIEIDMDPTNARRGTVKTKNKMPLPANEIPEGWYSTWLVNYVPGAVDSNNNYVSGSVVCNNVYCHSSGYVSDATKQYQFQQTPDWYWADSHNGVSAWAGQDSCSKCHGNSPNTGGKEGSSAHARHVVANHFKDVFDNISGKLKPVGPPGSGAVHGDPATGSSFNCNVCHFDAVRVPFNDMGSVCIDCHNTTIVKGKMEIYSGLKDSNGKPTGVHINGHIDVKFMEPFNFKSKAQLRNSITSVQSVYSSWTRVSGYKTYSSYDLAKHKPEYVGGACSTTSCHNGTLMEWRTKGPLACAACHVGLPQ